MNSAIVIILVQASLVFVFGDVSGDPIVTALIAGAFTTFNTVLAVALTRHTKRERRHGRGKGVAHRRIPGDRRNNRYRRSDSKHHADPDEPRESSS